VEFLQERAGSKEPTVQLALLQILTEKQSLPPALRAQIEQWASDESSEAVSRQAARVLARHESLTARQKQ
jgi:hypothetical protein